MENQTQPTTPKHWAVLFITVLLVLVADQLTKAWIAANFALYETRVPISALENIFDLTYTRNTGAAFGLFESASTFFLVVAIIASGVIIYYYRHIEGNRWLLRVAMGLQMAGAMGNAIDRMTRGYVVDFLHVFYEPVGFDWPIFNIADMSIVFGVGILLVLLTWDDIQERRHEEVSEPQSSSQ